MKHVEILYLLLFCLTIEQRALAQTAAADNNLKQLQEDMYRYFSTNEVDKFNDAVEKLKAAALRAGDERLFYKAWANQATYHFTRISNKRGLEMGKDIRDYAQQHDSKYGLYTSTFATAGMLTSQKQYELAKKQYLDCLEFLRNYFPDESTAPIYLALAKISQNNNDLSKVREYAQKVLDNPIASKMHKLSALSYICFTYTRLDGSDLEQFNHFYEERQELKAEVGPEGLFGTAIEYEHALLNGDYEKAEELTEKMAPMERLNMKVRLYEKKGDYKEALLWYRRYRNYRDSVNVLSARQQAAEYSVELDVARAESEAKDLRLANKELQLQQIENELEQQRLEAEANELKLKNQKAELERATIQLEKATLDGITKELELRQKLMDAEAQNQAERSRQQTRRFIYIIIGIVLASLAYIIYRRKIQVKQLEAKNDQLSQAYDQLEKTTTAKERIESELRIARDIQMSMVPSSFPSRSDLDIYAYMMPAKEVGGDLYSFVLEGSSLYFCIGDVSGKGVPASLFMAQTIRLFHMLASQYLAPAAIATKMNNELSENNEQGMLVTMFIGQANLTNGQLDFCNCGHNPPVLGLQFLEVEPNAPLGLWSGLEYIGEHIEDIRHQRLFLYTDGLNEAEDVWHNQFGDDNIPLILEEHPAFSCQQTIDVMKQAVADHAGNAVPSDDLTMLCVKVMG